MMRDFHFIRPEWFWLLPLLGFLLWRDHRRKALSRSWQAVCDPELLSYLLIGNADHKKRGQGVYPLAFGALLALMALAGPVWEELEQPVFREQSALVLVLDLSRSMDASDIKPTRLTRARHKLIDILKNREEGQTALIVYAAEPFVVSPLTQDAETIISQVSALKTGLMPHQGSRADTALIKAQALLKQAGAPRGRILIVTDGLENKKEALEETIAELSQEGHQISILGVGTKEGAPINLSEGGLLKDRQGKIVIPKLDEITLKMFALQGGGRYQTLTVDDSDISTLISEISSRRLEEQTEDSGLKADLWQEEGPWLLLPLMLLAALAFRRGVIASVLLMILFLTSPAEALDWDGLWSRQDQRAAAVFSEGENASAAELFENKEWKAAAQYRAGKYQESVHSLEGIETPDALYNKGNALTKLGNLPEAKQSYQAALKINPEHEDARHNLELLQEQQEKQENQNKQENGDPSEDENGDPSEESGDHSEEEGQQQDQAGEQKPSEDQQANQGDQSEQDENKPSQSAENQSGDETEEQQEAQKEEASENEDKQDTAQADTDLSEQSETRQAYEQWLRRIPDDPGGLLRRKFLYQAKQQQRGNQEEEAW